VPAGSAEAELARQIHFDRLPRHVAVIMDGNGRWAGERHLPRVEGHRAGIEAVRDVIETSARLGLEVLTLYAFSTENWKRPITEVSTLMMLLKRYLRSELSTLPQNSIRFNVIRRPRARAGHPGGAPCGGAEDGIFGLRFNIALNYSGRTEIVGPRARR
jgi:undecaprenyl diphosphate synthase